MFERLGGRVFARRKQVLVVALLLLILGGIWGGSVSKHLSSGGYYDPHSESVRAGYDINHKLDVPTQDAIVLFTSQQPISDPTVQRNIETALALLPRDQVPSYTTYWTSHQPQQLSTNGRATYVTLSLTGKTDATQEHALAVARDTLANANLPGITVQYGGTVTLNKEISGQVSTDLRRAELISLPIVLVLLIIIFGSLVSAGLPLAVGILAIVGASAVLRLLTTFVSVSVFALNLVTVLGLGLAVDYALFVVSRFREELDRQPTVQRALTRTMATAGRTVAFSGVTIAASLASLILFPETFLRSMGYGGVAVVLLDVVAATTVLPALLAILGHRVNSLRLPVPWVKSNTKADVEHSASGQGADVAETGGWYRLAHSVMRRPLVYTVAIVAILAVMGAPFLNVIFGGYTSRVLPVSAPGRVVSDTLARDFPSNATNPIQVVVEGVQNAAVIPAYVKQLGSVPGAAGAAVAAVHGDNVLVQVAFNGDPISGAARGTLARVRAVPPPAGSQVLVGGFTAFLVDQLHSIGHVLPWMLAVMIIAMLVLLFLAFGSFVLPFKAVAMNALSIGASFGAVTWIFQSGHLSNLFGFSKLGYLDATDPILMLAVVFGLSMDYEVFLLSRIREEWDAQTAMAGSGESPDARNRLAVAHGLQRSGRIITSAALLLVIVVGAFATSQVTTLKLLGFGMALAIFVDATIVRAMLVPAVMRLLGATNWWAPAPLARWWAAHGVGESSDAGADPSQGTGRYETLVR
ncbi:MAG TPA: MMPL family transporter [Acidothermaceae bacterium]|nr:MMPL family transporter [Acidothermaceae bacterium]